jgi:serine/threonine protein kinase
MVCRCLLKDPRKRITAVQAQQHPWLKQGLTWLAACRTSGKVTVYFATATFITVHCVTVSAELLQVVMIQSVSNIAVV